MAITSVDYQVFQALRRSGGLPLRPKVLELGESEWAGDIAPLMQDIAAIPDPGRRAKLEAWLDRVIKGDEPTRCWDAAKVFYRAFLDCESVTAIDLHGTSAALRIDLNYPVPLDERFDILLNLGTAEHVFNVCQFFKSCHELTVPGGLMLHTMPFSGWVEHGFYSFNPTFYWDLAAANGYETVLMAYTEAQPLKVVQLQGRAQIYDMARKGELAKNAMIYAVFRKGVTEEEFCIPSQAMYSEGQTAEIRAAWYELR